MPTCPFLIRIRHAHAPSATVFRMGRPHTWALVLFAAVGAASLASATAAQTGYSVVQPPYVPSSTQTYDGARSVDVHLNGSQFRWLDAVEISNIDLSNSGTTTVTVSIYRPFADWLLGCEQVEVAGVPGLNSVRVPIVMPIDGFNYRIAVTVQGSPTSAPQAQLFPLITTPPGTLQFDVLDAHQGPAGSRPTQPATEIPNLVLWTTPDTAISTPGNHIAGGGPTQVVAVSDYTYAYDFSIRGSSHRELTGVNLVGVPLPVPPGTTIQMRLWDNADPTTVIHTADASLLGSGFLIPSGTALSPDTSYRIGLHISVPGGATTTPVEGYVPSALPEVDLARVISLDGVYSGPGAAYPTGPSPIAPFLILNTARATFGTHTSLGPDVGGDIEPQLTSCTMPRIGHPLRLLIWNAGAGPAALLMAVNPNSSPLSAFGMSILNGTIIGTPAVPLSAGSGSFELPVPFDPAMLGFELGSQVFVPDPTSPADLPLSHSRRLISRFGW